MKSNKCNAITSIEMLGHLEQVRCSHCGWTQLSTVYPESDVVLMDYSLEPVTVQIDWPAFELGNKVVQARQVFEELRDIPLSQLLQKARESPKFILGSYSMPIAINMQELGKANGLVVSILKPNSKQ